VNPTLGLSWRPAEAVDVYAHYATSFQTPTTTELANRPDGAGGFNPILEPEKTRSYEIGLRGRIGDRFTYQLAAFTAEVTDELIGFQVPDFPARTFFRNAGSARHRGFEAAIAVAPVADLTARFSYSLTEAEFRDYRVGDEGFDGNRIPGIAPHRVEGILAWDPRGWYAEVDGRYLSRMQVNDANTATSPPYAVFDIRAGFDALDVLGLGLAPFAGVNNVLDRSFNTSVAINAFGGRYYEPGPPRSLFAGVRLILGQDASGPGP
jgi:iron complex outermembrane receptor protein